MLAQRETLDLAADNGHFDIQRDLVCTADRRGYFLSLNSSWERLLGWSREELMSRPYIEFVHPDDQTRTIAAMSKIDKPDAEIVNFENRYCGANGECRWLR